MPGLAGIISSRPDPENQRRLQLMTASMMHETFYTSGSYVNEQAGVYLGWVCHKDSFVDCMPIWNETKDKCLLLYGETFLDRETIGALKQNGHDVHSDNASYLIHLFEERGNNCFRDLNGFFHGVLINVPHNEVILFNDRYGMQRVYYYEKNGTVWFSSEAKSLLKVCRDLREIVPANLGQLFSMGCVLGNDTLFKNIYLLPGASLWKFKNGSCEKKGYYFYQKEWENQERLEKEEFYHELKETFGRILPKYLDASRPMGMSLTGGLDTRMIMAYARMPPETFPCYTFGSMYRDSFDVVVARKVAGVCKQKHFTIRVGKGFLSKFDRLAEKAIYITDGCLDAGTGAAEVYINQQARGIASIRVTGNYGSEVLRSVRGFEYKPRNTDLFNGEFIKHIQLAGEVFTEHTGGHSVSFTVFKQSPWFNFNRVMLEQSQLTWRTPFMDNELVSLAYRAPSEAITSDEMSLRLVREGNKELGRIITNRGAGGGSYGLLSKWRQKYHEILHFGEMGYDYAMPQWLSQMDCYLRPFHLEKLFLGRHDFYHFRLWFRNELSNYLQEILLDSRALNRPYLNKRSLETMIIGHIRGGNNYVREINKALSAELIHRLLIENI
jgi:asparagine synthase (glutamine-hydrolysing)